MGKRKLHGHGFYVCDYTGLTIPAAMAFMPQWPAIKDAPPGNATKPTRRGAYLCWEAALAHARETADPALEHIEAYISTVTKTPIEKLVSAPSYKTLSHFGGTHTALSYFTECCKVAHGVDCVLIDDEAGTVTASLEPQGNEKEAPWSILRPADALLAFMASKDQSLTEADVVGYELPRKGRNRDAALTVWTVKKPGMALNRAASLALRTSISGACIITRSTKEASPLPRTRYIEYTAEMFADEFSRKRKRTDAVGISQ